MEGGGLVSGGGRGFSHPLLEQGGLVSGVAYVLES